MASKNEPMKRSIGFIGMGHMGRGMAQRLLDAGYHLTVCDRTRERAQQLGQCGADVAQTPRELAAGCEVVIVCVTDDAAIEQVMFGEQLTGVLT